MTNAFSLKGDWFLPETPDKRLSGEVSYNPDEGIHLELIGDFKDKLLGYEDGYYPTILGVVEGSRDISLFNCKIVSRGIVSYVKGSEMARPVMTFVVNTMTDGWFFSSDKDVIAKTLYIEIDGLAEWLHVSGFSFNSLNINPETHNVDLHYHLPEPILFEYPVGCNSSFDFDIKNLSQSVFRTTFEITQRVRLKIETNLGFSIQDIYRIIYEFQSFMMICTPGEPFVKSICFYNSDYSVPINDGTNIPRKITLFYHQHLTVKERKWEYMFMLIQYPIIKELFPSMILTWDKIYSDFEPAINLLVEQIRDKDTFYDNDFLNLAQAAETIHDRINPNAKKMPKEEYDALKANILENVPKRNKDLVKGLLQYGNKVSFTTRISDLIEICPQSIVDVFIPDKDTFIKEVRDSRNYYTHYELSNKKHVKRGYGLIILAERLQMLLVFVIMIHVGMDKTLLEKIITDKKALYGNLLESL